MKLLFDENLSPQLARDLSARFPGSAHVRDCGLLGRTDEEVWDHARTHGFTLVSKDSDFQQRSLMFGPPPKLVWLRLGNCSRQQLLELITVHEEDIRAFEANAQESVLVLA
jgi:predicted nuclease of predicted toxin-antitoxin system